MGSGYYLGAVYYEYLAHFLVVEKLAGWEGIVVVGGRI